jgi:CheY-like chemotaxis protein
MSALETNRCFVLIIEDDDAIRRSMQDVLELQGYRAVGASDGQEAINFLKDSRELPCVILLDMMMAGMNGWQFLDFQRNSEEFRDVPVIICSALSETAKSIKPAAIIPKPVQLRTLISAVRNFCHAD